MDQEQKEMVQRWIEEAIKPLVERIEALESQMTEWERRVDGLASEEHYHDEYASVDHVERSEDSFNSQMYRLRNDLDNLEYRANDIERKAERAQSTADNASRGRGGYW